MSNAVVVINASVQNAPTPSRLQQSIAAVSVGGTSTLGAASSGTYNSTTGLVTLTMAAPTTLVPGDAITVEWLRVLRPEEKFGSVEELRSRIARDIAEARAAAAPAAPGEIRRG